MGFDQNVSLGYGFTFTWNPIVHTKEGILAALEKRGYHRGNVKLVGLPIAYAPDHLAQIDVDGPHQVAVYVAQSHFYGELIYERPRDYWCRFRVVSAEEARRFYLNETMVRIHESLAFYGKQKGCGDTVRHYVRELASVRRFVDTNLDNTDAYADLLLAAMDVVGWQLASAARFLEADVASY
ncbi:hypothetical protein [Medusavirus stheno T3]|uniref:Uncharacterized protein n=1 Tax=Medusavirus stheno T3 TaxID=3069717 RepID=A0A7S8BDD1_9VIRU|nr:hypothetical protein QKU73_gp150 [Acanthamoeba castellanii medusavirus]QPB44331.1 hypothetical protein [Medusavirus stheno T3]